jgi:hypothetical protein
LVDPANPPNPGGAPFIGLSAVSCAGATACTAVGTYDQNSADNMYVTLAESWNGTSWQIQPTPNISGAEQNHLNGVSCVTPTSCIAVGNYVDYNLNPMMGTLAELWNGTNWTIQPTPNPAGANDLSGVSCSARTVCTAVGETYTRATLAERWNRTSWKIQPTP